MVATLLRIYRLDYLTTFGRDQGIDFLAVRDMLINHKLTLIGIKVSLADFFQGPIYLYILTPLFYIMRLNPLAGAYTAVFISLLTIFTLYFVVYKMFNIKTANLAAAFFAVSPQLVMFGNTPLYQNFTPLFILLGIWCLYQVIVLNKGGAFKQLLFIFLTGLSVGIGLELHFLVISLTLAILFYLVFFTNNFLKLLIFYLAGLILAASPTIIFELRHNFLNLHLLLNYFGNTQQNHSSFLSVWNERISYFVTHDDNFLILAPLLLSIYIFFRNTSHLPENFLFLRRLALITFSIILIFAIKLTGFGSHYLLPFLMLLLIIIPVFLTYIKPNRLMWIICSFFLGLNLIITFSGLNNNHGYFMPDGWSLKKIDQTAGIISESASSHPNFNVASLLDGDTRTYPLRYMLSLTNQPVQDFTSYPQNDYLYVVGKDAKQITDSKVWEINSLRPFRIEKEWQVGDGVTLYLLSRIKYN